MTTSRLLSKEEKRLLVDALRAAAKEARRAKGHALVNPSFICNTAVTAHVDELAARIDRSHSRAGQPYPRVELEKVLS